MPATVAHGKLFRMRYVPLLLFAACLPAVRPPAPNVGARYHVAVVTPSWQCSGVRLGPTTVLTAAHCLHPEGMIVLGDRGEARRVFEVSQVLDRDLAWLRVYPAMPGPTAPLGPRPQPGDVVRTYGACAPRAKRLTVAGALGGTIIGLGLPTVCPGDSGGGWYDTQGRLVGITGSRTLPGARVPRSSAALIR